MLIHKITLQGNTSRTEVELGPDWEEVLLAEQDSVGRPVASPEATDDHWSIGDIADGNFRRMANYTE